MVFKYLGLLLWFIMIKGSMKDSVDLKLDMIGLVISGVGLCIICRVLEF